jgi:urocanate hydratase
MFYDAYKLKREAECQLKKPDQLKVCLKTLQEIVLHLQRLFNWILTVETRIRFRGSPCDICDEKLEK